MKSKINFDHMPEYTLITTEGEASIRGFDDLLRKIVDSPEWVFGTNQLIDHRKMMMGNLTSNNIQQIEYVVKRHSKKLGNGPCAFVVKDAFGFGITRMYELIGGENIHHKVRVFYSINEAAQWLKQLK